MKNRIPILATAFALTAAVGVSADVCAASYDANWESLNSRPCPQWWKDAKFGIFVHWGLYSVPAFAPYDKDSVHGCYAEHYGNPQRWKKYPQFPGMSFRNLVRT